MSKTAIEREAILIAAYHLLGDGNGGEWDNNVEYTRAIVQLTSHLLGYTSDDEDYVLRLIRDRARFD